MEVHDIEWKHEKDSYPKPWEEVELRKEAGSGLSYWSAKKNTSRKEEGCTTIMQTLKNPIFCNNSVEILSPYLL